MGLGKLQRRLQPNEKLSGSVSRLFAVSVAQGPVRGYLVGRSSAAGIAASAEISLGGQGKVASTPVEFGTTGTRLLFPEAVSDVPSGAGTRFSTGLTLLNPQGRAAGTLPLAARVKVSVFDATGAQRASEELTLEAGQQVSKLLFADGPDAGFFRPATMLAGGYVVVTADVPVTGSMLIFTSDLSLMSAVSAQRF